jgi:AmiR/NasT family two-component response regulator
VPSVLVASFGEVARLGVLALVEAGSFQAIDADVSLAELPARIETQRPDAVVVDLERDGADEAAAGIARRFADVTVIACSADRPTMHVFPRGQSGRWRSERISAASFEAALSEGMR